jgi:integrase
MNAFLRALGVDIRMIKEILGHSDIGVTGNMYVHVDEQGMREALERPGLRRSRMVRRGARGLVARLWGQDHVLAWAGRGEVI